MSYKAVVMSQLYRKTSSGTIVVFIYCTLKIIPMTQSESMKKPSSQHVVSETVIIYIIAAVLLTSVWVIAFLGWQG